MAGITVRRMDECGDVRSAAARVFVDAYKAELSSVSRNGTKLARAFEHSFDPSLCYLAFADGEVVGLLGCSTSSRRAMPLVRRELRRGLGLVRGTFMYLVMRSEMNTKLPYGDGARYIESVGTASHMRGQGVCSALLGHVLECVPCERFVLEVVDTNERARRIYDRFGFVEFARKPEKYAAIRGFSARIYMECKTGACIQTPNAKSG